MSLKRNELHTSRRGKKRSEYLFALSRIVATKTTVKQFWTTENTFVDLFSLPEQDKIKNVYAEFKI